MFDLKEDARKVERALLIGIHHQNASLEEAELCLEELDQLVENLEIGIVGREMIKIRQPQARFYCGTGKANEILGLIKSLGADCLVFDEVLTPSQQRNWEKMTGICVIDRQEVILDIFSSRARTREAHLQIELAKSRYSLPRLKHAWTHLSRQRGGGTVQRGEGELQLEMDRRMVRRRIEKLERELAIVRKQRATQRKLRQKTPVPNAAIVGYTNAGKSSMLNRFTGAHVLAEDKLFATLDPTTKPIELPTGQPLLLTDTVGFIRKLPHLLVESFKATLEEAVLARFLIHVVDVNSEQWQDHYDTTLEVLEEIGVETKAMIPVFNKIDLLENQVKVLQIRNKIPDAIFISTYTGEGMEELRERMAGMLKHELIPAKLLIPMERYDAISLLHRCCEILEEEYLEDNTVMIKANLMPSVLGELEPFITAKGHDYSHL